jgi:hypothetical protein
MAAALPYLALAGAAAAPKIGEAIGDAASGAVSKLRSWLHFSKGGYVTGKRPIRAVLHPGELVVPRAVVSRLMKRRGQPGKAPARKAPARKAPARKAPARKARR